MGISKITIKNYRGIRLQDITVPPGGLIAAGVCGVGKTSVLRALQAALAARGVGFEDVHQGEEKAEILVTLDDGMKIRRTITKAYVTAPHEVLLVIDGNTGQNALAQVKAFDEALELTGLIVTKLDGTAKGGVLCAIAREKPVPVYFVGVGEKLEDLETFNAREFAQALLG